MTKRISKSLLVLLVFLLLGSSATSQQQSFNYGFVSPNTRDDLKLEEAIRGMSSTEETDLLKRARSLGCVIKRKISTLRALGSWSDGAEHSIMLRVNSDESTVRYLMSRLGRDANQKAVIYFHPDNRGSARIYEVSLSRRYWNLASIAAILDKAGVAFRTLVPTRQNTMVYVVDTENNLGAKVKIAAKRLRGRLASRKGIASFIGDDADRTKGQTVFTKEITDFETKHSGLPPPCVSNYP